MTVQDLIETLRALIRQAPEIKTYTVRTNDTVWAIVEDVRVDPQHRTIWLDD